MSSSTVIYLEFPRTDGSSDKWPLDKLDPTPVQNEVNYMRHILPEEPLSLKWRVQIGREVAKLLQKSEIDNYVLKDFPEGYRFYHHNKGSVHDPRTDAYLYGSPSGRYRSPPEFIPHAYWLMTDETLNRKNCRCKYCGTSKQTQTEISQSLGLRSSHSRSVNGSSIRGTKPKLRLVAQPRNRQSLSSIVNHDRTADLRASRRYRPGELVWCALSPPIQGERDHEYIAFWPALVNEARLKSDVLPHPPDKPWRVVQSTTYRVKLLGVMHMHVLPDTAVLPYQAYGPSMEMIECLRLAGNPTLLEKRQRLLDFYPIPLGIESDDRRQLQFAEASTPFAFAIQIAAHLVRMWTPSDEWKFRGEVASPSPATSIAGPSAASSSGSVPVVEVNEIRYQGLWWGAERIWADELVRLQPARGQVVPQGSSVISPPSPGADGRGVLMRINSIIAVAEGPLKEYPRECKVAGVLYELADEAYEEEKAMEAVTLTPAYNYGASPAPMAVGDSVAPVDVLAPEDGPGSVNVASIIQATPPQRLSPTSQINLPNIPTYPLPKPPPGFKFRPITRAGYEIVLDASFISGRYYPELLKHPLLQVALADTNSDDTRVSQLHALCGLLAGAVNSMECVDWVATRLGMVKESDTTAQQELLQHWHPPDVEMNDPSDNAEVGVEGVVEGVAEQ